MSEKMFGVISPPRDLLPLINNNNNDTKHFFPAHTPAGAESDLNTAAAAPSQTEVTDLNCSDHSTTSKEMARGELW